jgi:outer membrane receptor for ferric coprogen and ferric-rhodotorulic acid
MDDFGASINEALRLATGINVEEWETNRPNNMARGFEIKSTQIDGVGLPNDRGIVTGDMDSCGYEKIEVVRGANGLLTGIGNSSGTIN